MKRAVLLGIAWVCPVLLVSQESAKPSSSQWTAAVVGQWRTVHQKLLAMARDTLLPEDRLSWRPHADSRTMQEELRHVTIGLEMATAQIEGRSFNYFERLNEDAIKPSTRASIADEMAAALNASMAVVEQRADPRLIAWVEHQAEHYGKLVSNYRVLGVVPPSSRGAQRKPTPDRSER